MGSPSFLSLGKEDLELAEGLSNLLWEPRLGFLAWWPGLAL